MTGHDLVIRGGTLVDGSGAERFRGDIAVRGGEIVEVGTVCGAAALEIDARDLLVTPGFVDIHTHYDGHVTWSSQLEPSSAHGVTTVVTGNCGIGFAPCKADDRDRMVSLMSGVEDIPEIVMTEGLRWDWESFPDYLEAVRRRPHDIDVATLLPHSPLRVYVMGQRGADREPANRSDIERMRVLAQQAMLAGAFGMSTSRTLFHRDCNGLEVASRGAREEELLAIATAMAETGRGMIEVTFDVDCLDDEFAMLQRIAKRSGIGVRFSLIQLPTYPRNWRRALDLVGTARAAGLDIFAQVIGRPIGLMFGLSVSYNPFWLYPSYQAIARLPLTERVRLMRQPDTRAAILGDPERLPPKFPFMQFLTAFDDMYILGDPPNYEPAAADSVAQIAKRRGITPEELAYDVMLQDDGRALLLSTVINFADKNFGAVEQMLGDQGTLLGLGDAGAHLGMVCDGSFPTFMLTHWVRDRPNGERIALEKMVHMLTHRNARSMGMNDRGLLRPGYKADINIIDFEGLRLRPPRARHDLPGGGLWLDQTADGYVATIVAGKVIRRDGVSTGELPGQLVRSAA